MCLCFLKCNSDRVRVLMEWAINGLQFNNDKIGGYYGGCNTDIQLHINKGVIGLRIDNIIGFNNINILNCDIWYTWILWWM